MNFACCTAAPECDRWVDLTESDPKDKSMCKAIPVPRRTVREEVRRQKLRASRIANRLLAKQSEIDRWLESYTVTPKPKAAPAKTLLDRLGPRKAANG